MLSRFYRQLKIMPPKVFSRARSKRPVPGAVSAGTSKKLKTEIIIDAPTIPPASSVSRCAWAQGEVNHEYHDQEWGVFQDDDQYLFEMLILEGAQAGLSWTTILNKRSGYRRAFDNFDISRVASYNAEKMAVLKEDPGIVRNRLKIRSAVANANVVIAIQNEYGSFATYLWSIVNANRIDKYRGTDKRVAILSPDNTRIISTDVSDALSKDLKKRGMSFVGTTIMYAYMQAVGLVNDHELTCFRRGQV